MTDDKIVAVLKEWSERGMTFGNIGMPEFARNILSLIDRKNAEIEALYKILKRSDEEISELNGKLAKRQNLEESFSKTMRGFDKRLAKTVRLERDKTIKEFAERLKKIVQFTDDTYECWEIEGYIDDLVKEMTEVK